MRRFAAILALALVGRCGEDTPTPLASSDAEPPPAPKAWTCRADAAPDAPVVERLSRNSFVRVQEESEGWSRLDQANPCWVKSELLSPSPTYKPPPQVQAFRPTPSPQRYGATAGGTYYRNCSAARAAGAAPVYAGEPGYARHLDRDGDGVGCER
jgi:hypothetical protein